ncbi:COG complex component [Daedalea quercina L-15889]|uniref:Conserved oligomeric Golgi complex subunit 2 n=1 Tax=Daedalea quercina L-15889 TaxID=1314783 RepID=A0A165SCW0_9APHY|nr:COG complex component [Daedalea quercina L-15889]
MSSLKSPEVEGTSDPFDLQRLAEELATREQNSSSQAQDAGEEISKAERDLPVYVPLSHSNLYLSATEFSVEEFLLSRSYTSLPDLRSELRDYLAALKEELVKLINDDYEAFISLSTDLRGEGARLERLKAPLSDIKSHVLEARKVLQVVKEDIEVKLSKRSTLREEKAFLHLLLKISESITRLESLLLISSPADAEDPSSDGVKVSSRFEDRTRGNRAKHLARVAAEYTQLLYHAAKARTGGSAFVDESQWRIDRIQSTLSSDLDHLFASTLASLTSGNKEQGRDNKTGELDKVKWIADVTECLRTYDVLGLWRDAEDVLRREVVRDFVKKTIHPGALASPHSPILPHTPLPPKTQITSAVPRTPYTPFTVFASKQNPFEFSTQQAGAQAHILDDREDPLAGLYNTVLRFVDRDLRRLMEIAERVCVKSASRSGAGKATANGGGGVEEQGGFEIMANVVWAEIGRAIMDELGSVVFAAGKPEDFRKHHETTQAFIRSLEFLAPSVHAIEVMRTHPVYVQFERRWQLPVYFQLRWKEIVARLEEALTETRLERTRSRAIKPFVTTQAAAVWDAISTCWSAPVYIPELSHRFWKFNLQLLSRYKTWLQSSLPALEVTPKVAAAVAAERLGSMPGSPGSLSRAATPNLPTEAASPEAAAADEQSLYQFSTAIIDIRAMESQMWKIWHEELNITLPEVDAGEGDPSPEDALRQALQGFTSMIPPLSSQIITILSRRACEALLSMRSIPSQFRAMSSSRRIPTEPSYFVSLILKPVKSFFGVDGPEGPGQPLKEEFMQAYVEEIFDIVAQRYIHFLSAMRKTEESLRRLKKGKKSTFSLFGGSTTKEDDGRADEEKIRAQMVLDVAAFGKDAESLGVAVQHSETFKVLEQMAGASFTDDA